MSIVTRTPRTDDSFPSHPGEPYTYPQARIPERAITEEGVRQYTGPIIQIEVSQTNTTGTVSVIITDVANTVLASNPVQFSQNGTLYAPTTHPVSGIDGTYTYTFTLDPKHNIVIMPIVHQIPPNQDIRLGGETFDIDANANVESITVSIAGNTATVNVQFDSDTAETSTAGQYSFNNGTSWSSFTVQPDETGQFTWPLNGSDQPFLVRGINRSGVAGPPVASNIPGQGMSLVTMVQISSTEVIITWFGVNVTLSIDGGAFAAAPPDDDPVEAGNQLTVTRDSSDHAYVFQSTVNGQSTTNTVHIPALGTSGSSGGTFDSLTNVIDDYTANTVQFGWSWSGDPSAAFNVYVSEGGVPYTRQGSIPTTASGATNYVYTSSHDLDTVITPTIDIGFYVEAVVGSTVLGARSVPCDATYGYNP